VDEKEMETMQRTNLLRFMLLCTDQKQLAHYTKFAEQCLSSEARQVLPELLGLMRETVGSDNVYHQRYLLLVAFQATRSFFEWVKLYSPNVDAFSAYLDSRFTWLVQRSKAGGEASTQISEVCYPTVTHFVDDVCAWFSTQEPPCPYVTFPPPHTDSAPSVLKKNVPIIP